MRRIAFDFYRDRLQRVLTNLATITPTPELPSVEDFFVLISHTIETTGAASSPTEFADCWCAHLNTHHREFGIAKENLALGINPPTSGAFNNDFWGECSGGLAAAIAWGIICPGDATNAAAHAAEYASISHCKEAIEASHFVAAIVAESFTANDARSCIRAGLRSLSAGSGATESVEATLAALAGRSSDEAWAEISAEWVNHAIESHVFATLAAITLTLVAGNGDINEARQIVQDTGVEAYPVLATVTAVLGGLGLTEIAEKPKRGRAKTKEQNIIQGLEYPTELDDVIERVSRIAIACSSPTEVEIVGSPYVAVSPSVAGPVRLITRYEGAPVLAPGEERAVFLETKSDQEDIHGTLNVKSTDALTAIALGGISVPGMVTARAVNVTLKNAECPIEPVQVEFKRASRCIANAAFGFRRASLWVAYGPFDNKTGEGFDAKHLNGAKLRVDSDHSKLGCSRKVLYIRGDEVDIDGAFGSVGPRIIYLARTIHSPKRRKVTLRIGSTDGIQLWLNGRSLINDHGHRSCTPNDFVISVTLQKGANHISAKLARCTDSSLFRMRITEANSECAITDLWEWASEA